ncbi:type VII toxin-antitoxin system HepT family RNase toxin [Methanosarcina sp.]|uniref:type VII toxin-antitoxin system HepT family RNase toxin n=1 Tax=Methanosarcina sp. TaxID=2213 RepID=UPI002AB9F820|nr:DUF86 domain-containing protein [Methanosarcina sp.]MDY9927294.1 DUF86 domain-containing protein [Methanosarcina sp.]
MSAIDRIVRKLNFMQRPVNYLKSIDPESINLEENYEARSAIERNFQLAIECAIDIGEIIISKEGFERPEDYRSVFLILGKHGVLPKDFAEKFSAAAGFRNFLVHIYENVDLDIIEKYLVENLEDFDTFASYVAEYIEKIQR